MFARLALQKFGLAAVTVALWLASGALARADIIGVASVIDGDSRAWRCGQRAALALQDLIGRRTVSCDERDVDRYERIVGRCLVGEVDINGWLVAQGLALAYRRYSRDYVAAEEEARASGRGMWAGTFELPWEWRRRQ